MQNICVHTNGRVVVTETFPDKFYTQSQQNSNAFRKLHTYNTYYAKCSFQLFVQYLERKQISKMEAVGAFAHRDHMLRLP